MFQFIVRRLIQTIPVLIGVTILTFSMVRLIPGDPAQIMAGESASQEQIELTRERLGLNDPLPVQYFDYVSGVVTGDLGNSIRNGRPVADEIKVRIGTTVSLAFYSTLLSVFLGIIFGVFAAVRRGKLSDTLVMIAALFGLSMPNFWLGLILIQYFAIGRDVLFFNTGWFLASGWGTWQQMVLPVITLGTAGAAIIARMTRSSMLEVIDQDYIRTARAKGVKERIVVYRHALKNALIPVVTVVGLQFGALLGGAVITENVFAINGLGRLMVGAINSRDFPIVQSGVLVFAFLFVFVNIMVDVIYRLLNKRIDLN
ncbi:glutathione ABC transporter permease [Halolactibacillus alkaliphilus]|uniref:Glutathione ABC transporter permease n=1 Tax=Halolactibacillus alkaliphilus TaxID=442899 RepID=A0A511X548_9BACI|nr:ABC transporter permease [Halolactibacillus alkaliphilus]GEN58078.1 glutathione ABC transporter permease [Halolactibacillus alkaliphilus]GGN76376.1 glutathione ABC transporter permease [Halolactibacillus alkaliphilus]SFP12933.1 peptide/nickel transport system permease protein [Halolactibacillus alkaliphilus]